MSDVIYLSHGGGPMPLLDRRGHKNMLDSYKDYSKGKNPKAIIVVSAHYETDEFSVIFDHPKDLLFDYYGFPKESYTYQYNPPIDSEIGKEILEAINSSNIVVSESKRGFDHGVFIPLMIMFEEANIPVVQISLKKGLDPVSHIKLGKALSSIKDVMIIGSGSSYHNLREFMSQSEELSFQNNTFHDELINILTSDINEAEREQKLINWDKITYARRIHPREEHLIPLLVCYGVKHQKAKVVFDEKVMTKRNICVSW